MLRNEMCVNIIVIVTTILAAAVILTLTGFAKFGTAQGQADSTSLAPDQKAAICDPSNPSSNLNPANTTESKICGIQKTVKPSISSDATTGTDTETAAP